MMRRAPRLPLEFPRPGDIWRDAARAGARPDSRLTVSEWADKHRILSGKSAAEAGPWRTSRTPYLREIMDALSTRSPLQRVILMKGAQVGATEAGNNWLGYIIHHAPAPTLAVMPTVEAAQRNSKLRIKPLIENSPVLRSLVREARARDSGNTTLLKEFPGGILSMTGANSAVGLRSMPARNVFCDEVDAYPGDVDEEGDPLELAIVRTSTYERSKKIFICSTPLIKGVSKIESLFLEGDQRYYFVPCPHCGEMQRFQWTRLLWNKGQPASVRYDCAACAKAIYNHHKTEMLARGEWRSTGEAGAPYTASFHLSSLYSPVGWLSWATIAERWEKAQRNPEKLKAFTNTVLGESWEERGEAPEWQKLYGRRVGWPRGTAPAGVMFLTAGVDIQQDRIEVQVLGWGRDKQKWVVDYIVLNCSPQLPQVWNELTDVLNSTWRHASGVDLTLMRMAVDSGYATQQVYQWARRQGPGRVLVVKGQQSGTAPIGQPSAVDVDFRGKKFKRGAKVWPVATGLLKSQLYGWLNLDAPTEAERAQGVEFPPGYVHFPNWLMEEYFQQLTAEQLLKKIVKGYARLEWVNTRPGSRNEGLDTFIYAMAAAVQYGIDRFNATWWLRTEEGLWGPGGYTAERDRSGELTEHVRNMGALDKQMEARAGLPAPPKAELSTSAPVAMRRESKWLGQRKGGWIQR